MVMCIDRSQIVPTEYCKWRERRCWGEVHDENSGGLGGVSGHAGLFGTADDLLALADVYMGKTDFLSPEMVKTSVKEYVCAPDGTRRGLGWMLRAQQIGNADLVSHCGNLWPIESFGHTGKGRSKMGGNK